MKRTERCVAALFSVLLLVSCGKKTNETPKETPVYETMQVSRQDADLKLSYPVNIKGTEDVEIRPRVDGFIKEIFVDEGSVVKKGQVLFTIDSPTTESNLSSAKAVVNSAQAQVNTAKLNVERIRPLAEKNIVSNVQLETYENSYQAALASLAQAKASLTNAQAARSWATVTSPVDGVVGQISYRKGSLVSSSNAITTVANIGNVFAYFSLNERALRSFLESFPGTTQAEKIKNMPPVTLVLSDGTEYPDRGRIQTISGVFNGTTGTTNFRAEFPNKRGELRSGASGTVIIPETKSNVFVIPQNSTFARQDKTLVYKVQGDSVVQTVISVINMPDGQNYAVTDGLKDGDRIVKSGVSTLTQGMKIKEKK